MSNRRDINALAEKMSELSATTRQVVDDMAGAMQDAYAQFLQQATRAAEDDRAKIAALTDVLAALSSNVAALQESVAALTAAQAQTNARLDALTDALTQTNANLAAHKAETSARLDALTDALTQTNANLAAHKAETNARLDALTDALTETNANLAAHKAETSTRLDALTDAQAKTNARLDALTDAQAETNARLDALTNAQAETNARLDTLSDAQADTKKEMAMLSGRVSNNFGSRYEQLAARLAPRHIRRLLGFSATKVSHTAWQGGAIIDAAANSDNISDDEAGELGRIDLVVSGNDRNDAPSHLVAEISVTVQERDVIRAVQRAGILRRATGQAAVSAVIGTAIDDAAMQAAQRHGVLFIAIANLEADD